MHSDKRLTCLSEEKLYSENLAVKETLANALMLISLIKYKRSCLCDTVTPEALAGLKTLIGYVQGKIQSMLDELDQHPIYAEAANADASNLAVVDRTRVSVPVKKFKNKKLAQKVKRLKDFCVNVNSYIETINFKLKVREIQLLSTPEASIEELVGSMLGAEKKVKLTSIKVIYIYLRDGRLYPKSKHYPYLTSSFVVQLKLLRKLVEKLV